MGGWEADTAAELLTELIRKITEADYRVTQVDLRYLLSAGVTAEAMVVAFVGAANGRRSRGFHRALAMLRDLSELPKSSEPS